MRFATTLLIAFFAFAASARGYAVLTHEALVDVVWDTSIRPLLLKRFPLSSPEQLKQAHAFCYGGAIIQDIGYYPFGNRLFSDLTHYVRSGDFVLSLLNRAADLNEYAFAIGALAHYEADNEGHPLSINRTVPELYPKLRRKYGDSVTYAQDPTAHVRTEFGFDVLQVARNFYPSQAYHDFIGFQVAEPLMEQACLETYGLKLTDIFRNPGLTIGTYRFSVKTIIPEATKAAWSAKKDSIRAAAPGVNRKRFIYNLSRSAYRREWGNDFQEPGWFERFLAFLIRWLPKVGPLRLFAFRVPPADAELQFEKAFDITAVHYRADLDHVADRTLTLPNRDLDTGKPSEQGEYALADQTYSELLQKLADLKLPVPASLEHRSLNRGR